MARPTNAELETIRDELLSAKAEYSKLSKLLNESMSKINSWATKSEELSEQHDRLSTLIESAEAQNSQLTKLIDKTEGLASILKSDIDAIKSQSDKLSQNLSLSDTETPKLISLNKKSEETLHRLEKKENELSEQLKKISETYNDLNLKIKSANDLSSQVSSLLPKAATASLSSAFKIRRESFKWSKWGWTLGFICSVILLLSFAWNFPPPSVDELKTTFDPLWGYLLGRLPLSLPLFFLLGYSAIRMGQISKLEEEYAHKEALATSFEGFKKQLIELEKELNYQEEEEDEAEKIKTKQQLSMTLKLVQDTLEAISYHPRYVFTHEEKPTFMGKLIEIIHALKNDKKFNR